MWLAEVVTPQEAEGEAPKVEASTLLPQIAAEGRGKGQQAPPYTTQG